LTALYSSDSATYSETASSSPKYVLCLRVF
jgi:hypothetical protein